MLFVCILLELRNLRALCSNGIFICSNLILQLLVCICASCCFCIDFSGIFIYTSRKISSTIGQRSIDTGLLFQCIDLPMLFVYSLIECIDFTGICIDFTGIFIDFTGICIHTITQTKSTIGQRSIDTGFLFQCIDLPMLFVCILIEFVQCATDGIIFLNNISILLIISALIQLTENSFDIVLICINLIHLFSIESTIGIIPLSLELFDSSLVLCNLILYVIEPPSRYGDLILQLIHRIFTLLSFVLNSSCIRSDIILIRFDIGLSSLLVQFRVNIVHIIDMINRILRHVLLELSDLRALCSDLSL